MCVVICCKDKFPSKEILEACESVNSDGAGCSYLLDGKVKYHKGIESKKILEMIDDKTITLPCVIHFRISSCGETSPELTHPFPITKDMSTDLEGVTDKVLFHNGTWSSYDEKIQNMVLSNLLKVPSGKWSDTRTLAFICAYLGEDFLSFITGFNRFCVFDSEGFRTFGDGWETREDIVYSNLHWEYRIKKNGLPIYNGYRWDINKKDFVRMDNKKPLEDTPIDELTTLEIDELTRILSSRFKKYQMSLAQLQENLKKEKSDKKIREIKIRIKANEKELEKLNSQLDDIIKFEMVDGDLKTQRLRKYNDYDSDYSYLYDKGGNFFG